MRQLALDALSGLDPVGRGQADVHQDDVRRQLLDQRDRFAPVPGLADDLHVTLELQDVADATPEERVTVDDHDPGLDAFIASIAAATPLLRLRLTLRLA